MARHGIQVEARLLASQGGRVRRGVQKDKQASRAKTKVEALCSRPVAKSVWEGVVAHKNVRRERQRDASIISGIF